MKKSKIVLIVLVLALLVPIISLIPINAMDVDNDEVYVHYYPIFTSIPCPPFQQILTDDGEIYVHYYPITMNTFLPMSYEEEITVFIGVEGMTEEEIEIELYSMLTINCRICGSFPVTLLRTVTGVWRFTGSSTGPHIDGTFSFEYRRSIDYYYRGACGYNGRHTITQTQWFNQFNRP